MNVRVVILLLLLLTLGTATPVQASTKDQKDSFAWRVLKLYFLGETGTATKRSPRTQKEKEEQEEAEKHEEELRHENQLNQKTRIAQQRWMLAARQIFYAGYASRIGANLGLAESVNGFDPRDVCDKAWAQLGDKLPPLLSLAHH